MTLADGRKVGMQAKYVFSASAKSSLWRQLDKSVTTALQTHCPDLCEYHVYVPCDRDKDAKSWNNHVIKWKDAAKRLGYLHDVDFIWHGASELLFVLMREQNRPLLHYWFGARLFSTDWIKQKFDASRKLIYSRYTPDCHVRTDSERVIDAFFLSNPFLNALNTRLASLWKILSEFTLNHVKNTDIDHATYQNGREKLRSLITPVGYAIPSIRPLMSGMDEMSKLVSGLYSPALEKRRAFRNAKEADIESTSGTEDQTKSNPYDYALRQLNEILTALQNTRNFLEQYRAYDSKSLLVKGEAGMGKSHLLCRAVETGIKRDQPCILMPGERFSDARPIQTQLCELLSWDDGQKSLFGALQTAAQLFGKPAIIAIDALNESVDRKLWRTQLLAFISELKAYPDVRLLVSCRTDFCDYTLPEGVKDQPDGNWAYLTHRGFREDVFKAVATYFNRYSVRSLQFPPLIEEFSNPLFLKLFCEAYQNQAVPCGTLSFQQVMEKRLFHCGQLLLKEIDCSEQNTRRAVFAIAQRIAEKGGQAIPEADAREECLKFFNIPHESKSLYRQLVSNGILVQTILPGARKKSSESAVGIRFPYERFSDYLICVRLLEPYTTVEELRCAITAGSFTPTDWLKNWSLFSSNRGLLRMVAILIPEKYTVEWLSLLPDSVLDPMRSGIRPEMLENFLHSLVWRSSTSMTITSPEWLERCERELNTTDYLKVRAKLFVIPESPYNILPVHEQLKNIPLPERETTWTIPATECVDMDEGNTFDLIINWAFQAPRDRISEEQTWLVALTLTWLLGSNCRRLRTKATTALIHLLDRRIPLVCNLLDEFHDCNDPYIVERVYAVVCGVAMREPDNGALGKLAGKVYERVFSKDTVLPHILLRDYAQTIIELAAHRRCLGAEVVLKKCRPPFKSIWPSIMTEKEARQLSKQDGWETISSSLQPEAVGGYGDFGRYVMDYAVHHFSSKKRRPKNLVVAQVDYQHREVFSGLEARRYILGRVQQLGWTPERFNAYENALPSGRLDLQQEITKIERISKKYQWIGLNELLGYLSDHRAFAGYWDSDARWGFEGVWQLGLRDFNPSVEPDKIGFPDDSKENTNDLFGQDEQRFIDFLYPFEKSCFSFAERDNWIRSQPKDYCGLIELDNVPQFVGKWLVLSGHYNFKEPVVATHDADSYGKLQMWVDVRCLLVRRRDFQKFVSSVGNARFYGVGLHIPDLRGVWLGEYPWAPACKQYLDSFTGDPWLESLKQVLDVWQTAGEFQDEVAGFFDKMPSPMVCEAMGLSWAKGGSRWCDGSGQNIAACVNVPDARIEHNGILIVKRDEFLAAVESKGYVPVWAVLSERACKNLNFEHRQRITMPTVEMVSQRVYCMSKASTFEEKHRRDYDVSVARDDAQPTSEVNAEL